MANLLLIFLMVYIQEPWRWKCIGDFRVVNSISCDQRYVYIGGTKGIMRFDKLKEQWETPVTSNPFPDSINMIAVDVGANEVWFTTRRALGRYNPVFEDYRLVDFPPGYGVPCSLGISVDYIYLWDRHQCMRFNKLSNEWSRQGGMPSDAEWFPKALPTQYPWLAPYYVMDKYLNQYRISCAVEDEQWIWVGTRGQGIYKYNKTTHMDEHFILGISVQRGMAMMRDGEHMWVGTPQEIVRWDLDKGLSTYYLQFGGLSLLESEMPELKIPSSATSMVGEGNRIWLGTAEGLFQFDKQSGDWNKLSSEMVTSLAVERSSPLDKDKLWIGTQNRLAKLENNKVVEVFKDVWVNDIKVREVQPQEVQPQADEVWVATSRGILRKSGDEWSKFDDPDKVLAHGVYKILFDGDRIYFGTTRQGLLVYESRSISERDENDKWDRFAYPVYLPGERILSISADSVELYVGTDAGVAVWDKERNLWEKYTQDNSPIKGSVYSISLDKESVYFGTDGGLVELKRIIISVE